MEEKTHFKHEANIKLYEMSAMLDESNYTIVRMSNLQPMATKWFNKDNQHQGLELLYLDFYEEVVYNKNFENINDRKLGQAVLEVIKQKKIDTQKHNLPQGIIENLLDTKKQAEEGRPSAREFQV